MAISRSLLFLVERYFCCMDSVSRLEEREEVKWGEKEGKQREDRSEADSVGGRAVGEGVGLPVEAGEGKLEAPGAVLWWPPYQKHLQLH